MIKIIIETTEKNILNIDQIITNRIEIEDNYKHGDSSIDSYVEIFQRALLGLSFSEDLIKQYTISDFMFDETKFNEGE